MKKQKMNVLFKIAFILLIVCVLMIFASIIIAYAFDSEKWSAIVRQAVYCLQQWV